MISRAEQEQVVKSISDGNKKQRCDWVPADIQIYADYHDTEWGVPQRDDIKLFEFLVLEGFQAGLSWLTVLKKRENFRETFGNFDPHYVASMTDQDVERIMQNGGIIRNRSKIRAAISNARCFIRIQKEYGTFSEFVWQFAGGKPLVHSFMNSREIPAFTEGSDRMSLSLRKMGFGFVGSTICYSYMQAVGMVNDHTVFCYRRSEIISSYS
ncbi:MAG TPA: DNA-3-methyladenine glycosylase I [Thermoplasmataceae archaeon]|nr:DNA-3-methyladenine glycosylase I [Thermoplasmataceae archaeon]